MLVTNADLTTDGRDLIDALPQSLRSDLDAIRTHVVDFITREFHTIENANGAGRIADQSLELLETWLLDAEQKQLLELNPWDVFFLYAAAYVSNIRHAEASQTGSRGMDHQGARAAHAAADDRDLHKRITRDWQAFGIRDASIAAAIADIVAHNAYHQQGDDAPNAIRRKHRFDEMDINIPLVASAIQLAQALLLQSPMTANRVGALLPPTATITKDRYDAAFSVTRMGPHPYAHSTIQIKMQCQDPEIHRALKHHERAVQKMLHHINNYASPRFLYSDVIFEIDALGYSPVDLKFSVDTSAALKLLTGNRLYSDNRVFLRELIQNAVDACNLRKRLEPDYQPAISIHFNQDISIVTVRDNGIGMDRQWIEKYFLTIGISLYQSSEVRSARQRSRIDFSFISQFGIGFLSSFLVAEKIIIKTRKQAKNGLMISIANLKDYFDVRTIDHDFGPGTEVTLHLKKSKINYCRSLEYTGYLKTNIRFIEIPVELVDQDGQSTTIGRDTLAYRNSQTPGVDYIASLDFKHSEGYVLVRAKKNVDRIFAVDTAKGGISVFQDGIFITQLDTLLPEGARQHAVGRINLKGKDKCALSMDRNRIFWTNTQLMEIKRAIRKGLADATRQFMDDLQAQEAAENTRKSIVNNLAIFFDFNDIDDAVHHRLSAPIRSVVEKRFRDFIRIHFAHTYKREGILEADGYSHDWQRRIVDSFRRN